MSVNQPNLDDLPIQGSLPAILEAVAANMPVVLAAPPGAGKTTAVPLTLLNAGLLSQPMVMIEPRRMAARSSARRIAALHGSALGTTVGYQVRFDKQASAATQLLVATPGILLRRIATDPVLSQISCVLLDEFHERNLEYDLLLGILVRLRETLRPDLRVLIMSATLDVSELQRYLPVSQPIISQGRSYPVEIRYASSTQSDALEQQIATQLPSLLQETAGHVLVFLPGRGEIARVHRHLTSSTAFQSLAIDELYGEQTPEAQDAVLRPSSHRRVILSTNVAETSVTIENVTAVIDSGLARIAQFDATVGLPRLRLEPISLAAADQRAGRAGRTAPGICVRLWPQVMDRQRRSHPQPEILRTDLCDALLQLCGWGETDFEAFPWLTPPRETSIESAIELLRSLGAIDSNRQLTPLGKRMQRYSLHPRLSRLMLAAEEWDCHIPAALVASLLADRSPFLTPANRYGSFESKLNFLQAAFADEPLSRRSDQSQEIHSGRLRELLRSAKQILRDARAEADIDHAAANADDNAKRLTRALLQAFPDRVAKLRSPGATTGVLVGGRGIQLSTQVPVDCQWVLCLEVDDSGKQAKVREYLPVEVESLSQSAIEQREELEWSDSNMSVVLRERLYYGDLIISETPKSCRPSPEAANMLRKHASRGRALWYPDDDHAAASFIRRVQLLARCMPDLGLEPIEDETLDLLLDELCQTRTSIEQLRRAPWLETLQGIYNYPMLQAIDRHAPTHLTLPSGNRAQIHYQADKTPFLEARIQELFGWQETPRIAGGRVRLQIHLLGPNYRPQQITEDLANFWNVTYFDVRKELKRRYPKHHWPDVPQTALATRNGLQPR